MSFIFFQTDFQLIFEIILEPKCVLHIGIDKSKENLIPFTLETLKNCYLKKEIRQLELKRKSKFDVIKLPERPDGILGYHSSCYRYYCAIHSKNKATDHENGSKKFIFFNIPFLC